MPPGHADSLQGAGCRPRPRERLWTLVKGGKRVDAELPFHGEHGVEVQFLHEDVMAYGHAFAMRAQALAEAEHHRQRLTREGWTLPETRAPARMNEVLFLLSFKHMGRGHFKTKTRVDGWNHPA